MALNALKALPYPRVPVTLGDHVKKRRMKLGLRQRDAARNRGVSVSTLIAWETNGATPAVCFLPRIMSFLDYDPYPQPQTLGDLASLAAGGYVPSQLLEPARRGLGASASVV